MENEKELAVHSIKMRHSTKKLIDSLKIHPRESYDDVIIRCIQKGISAEDIVRSVNESEVLH